MSNQRLFLSANEAKYKNARLSLLLILILSTVNLVSPFLGFYMLFSAYIPNLIAQVGVFLYQDLGSIVFYIISVLLAIGLLVPYFLAWLFSKKNSRWMIVALVLFSVDTLFFLIQFVIFIAAGDPFYIPDLIFHIYALVSLILAVNYGFKAETDVRPDYEALSAQSETDSQFGGATRTLTVTRKKALMGAAAKMIIYVNGKGIFELKNGESQTIPVPCTSFALGVAFKNGLVSNEYMVAEGDTDLSYTAVLKSGFWANKVFLMENR